MGAGATYKCKDCGYEMSFSSGWTFMSVPRGIEDEEYYIPIKEGKYGKTAQKILLSNPKAFVRVSIGSYYCDKCKEVLEYSKLTIEETIDNPMKISTKGYIEDMIDENSPEDKILYTIKPKCEQCGRVAEDVKGLLFCPKCGGENLLMSGMYFCD